MFDFLDMIGTYEDRKVDLSSCKKVLTRRISEFETTRIGGK